MVLNLNDLERRVKALGIGQDDEVSYTLDGTFCTSSMKMYINLLKQGRNVSMYHLTHGRAERCCAAYLKAVDEMLEEDDHDEQRADSSPNPVRGERSGEHA